MKRYQRGDKAKPGFYINVRRADFIQVPGDTPVIPPSAIGSYVKVQGILAAIIMAVYGLGMVLFLPFAAIVGLAAYAGKPFRRSKTATKKPDRRMMMTVRKSLIIAGAVLFFGALMYLGAAPLLAADPVTTVPANDPNVACVNCHKLTDLSMTLPDGESLSCYVDYAQFQASKHGAIVKCAICHADIAGNATVYPHPAVTATSIKDFKAELYQVCAECHTQEAADLQSSIHGLQNGVQIATCADCHSAHDTLATDTGAYKLQSVTDCSNCHGNDDLMQKYGLSTNVVNSYLQDFHGKTTYLIGEQAKNLSIKTAVCSDCHKSGNGISLSSHSIQSITSPNDVSIQQSFTAACQQCHAGTNASFAVAYLSHNQPSTTYAQADFWVTWFYRLMIAFVLIGLFIHIGFDVYKRRKNKKAKEV